MTLRKACDLAGYMATSSFVEIIAEIDIVEPRQGTTFGTTFGILSLL